jgi:sugar/nucleoside kinase (ribokinase family)
MRALFAGLTTLDLIYRSPKLPQSNQKLVATDYLLAAGGPATNAAIAFCHFGHQSTLLSAIGRHPTTHLLRAELAQWGICCMDLLPQHTAPPPISSIIVTEDTGERAVISINAVKTQASPAESLSDWLQGIDLVLIDGHQMSVGLALARQAKARDIPVVIDGGSWKPGFEKLLLLSDYAICSANFHPPDRPSLEATLDYLTSLGIPHIAITRGSEPIVYRDRTQTGQISVPLIQPVVDTLGAGDIFHGAFCHFILSHSFSTALEKAAQVAAFSCKFFGTRQWMKENGSADEGG